MAWRSDLEGFVRGLDLIRRAVVKQQGKELQHSWKNSSLKSAVDNIGGSFGDRVGNLNTDLRTSTKKVQETVTVAIKDATATMSMAKEQGEKLTSQVLGKEAKESAHASSESFTQMVTENLVKEFSIEAPPVADIKMPVKETASKPAKPANVGEQLGTDTVKLDSVAGEPEKTAFSASSTQSVAVDLGTLEKDSIKVTTTTTEKPKPKVVQPKQPVRPRSKLLEDFKPKLSDSAQERKVPSSRMGRVMSFGGLAAGLGMGALSEVTKKTFGFAKEGDNSINSQNPFLTEANVERIVDTLCRVRGAALKLGQMLSIQDESLLSPEVLRILERVRQSADFMPAWQMEKVLKKELGADWKDKFESFDDKPFAAASIGQVHKGVLLNGKEVALKIQYPGVAKSIESDINNLMGIMKVWNILPKGLYVDNVMKVAKTELAWEVDYYREADCCQMFRVLLHDDPAYQIPEIIEELTTSQVLTSEFMVGLPLDKCMELDQDSRNMIGSNILRLCLLELFQFRLMQTDPNWSNFFYNPDTEKVILLDFGATREFSKTFVDRYLRVIKSAADGDRKGILVGSQKLGFLTGYETKEMEEAHIDAVMILGEAFAKDGPFSFATQDTTRRIHHLIPVMMNNRLTPPPEETYSLHRKMSGAFLLCAKLRSEVNCKDIFDKVYADYVFDEEATDS